MTSPHVSAVLQVPPTLGGADVPAPRRALPSADAGGGTAAPHGGRGRVAALAEQLWSAVVVVAGFVTVLLGLVLVPLPGPGWLVVFAGLSMLSGRFVWARRARTALEVRLKGFARWFARLRLLQRLLLSLLSTALGAAGTWAWFAVTGLPTWLPESWTSVLTAVPGW